jgi:hypothetical protein
MERIVEATNPHTSVTITAMASFRDIRLTLRRLAAALLLIVVASHAAAPFAQPFERAAGSAFSAATGDVSLACGQPAAVAKRTLPAQPFAPLLITPLAPVEATSLASCRSSSQAAIGQTGPPLSRTTFSPLAPRAPPAA